MAQKKLLVIDDDTLLRDNLIEQFEMHEDFSCVPCSNAMDGINEAKANRYDLILLDVGLPDMDGREACKMMRRNNYNGPVIMLTAHDADSDIILGLEAGANDYVNKPFRFAVLLARIRAHLRQHEFSEDAIFSICNYQFQPALKQITTDDGTKIRLTEKECSILKFLYRNGEKVVSRDILLHEVWGYNSGVTTHTLETHIYRLRQKLEEKPSQSRILVTEAGGYRLNIST